MSTTYVSAVPSRLQNIIDAITAGPKAVYNDVAQVGKLKQKAEGQAWDILGQPVERVVFVLLGLLLVVIGLTQLRSVKTVVAVAGRGARKAVEAAGTVGVAA